MKPFTSINNPLLLGSPFIILLLLFLSPYVIFYKRRQALFKFKITPIKNWIAGHIGVIPSSSEGRLKNGYERMLQFQDEGCSPIFMGPIPNLSIFDPNIIAQIVATNKHTHKSFFYDFMKPWLGDGLLISNGDKWKSRRRLTTPAFHFEVLKKFLDVMNEQTDIMIERLSRNIDKEYIDFFEFVTDCALDIICETAMGKKVNAQSEKRIPYVKAVYDMSHLVSLRNIRPWLMVDFIFHLTSLGRQQHQTLKILHDFTMKVIEERRDFINENPDQIGSKPAFLDILLTSGVDDQPLSNQDIREEVDTFMFEGHDTTSASLAWTVHLLGLHPDIQEKVREEVNQVVGNSTDITIEMLSKLKYMEFVFKESLRLYPSVPAIGRLSSEDFEINGKKVLKGTNLFLSIYSLHRNPKYWEKPNEFIPERWESDIEKRHPFLYIPFSAGPRNCIGQNFAKNEEKVILSKFVKNFRFISLDKEVRLSPELILRPVGGIRIKIEKI